MGWRPLELQQQTEKVNKNDTIYYLNAELSKEKRKQYFSVVGSFSTGDKK